MKTKYPKEKNGKYLKKSKDKDGEKKVKIFLRVQLKKIKLKKYQRYFKLKRLRNKIIILKMIQL